MDMQQQPTLAPWPDGVIARYLTVAGATVDVETLTTVSGDDTYGTRSTCRGCADWDDRDYDRYRNYRERSSRARASQDEARAWAQAHAETCRALPMPEATQ